MNFIRLYSFVPTSPALPAVFGNAQTPASFSALEAASEQALQNSKFTDNVAVLKEHFPIPERQQIIEWAGKITYTGRQGEWTYYELITPEKPGCWTLGALETLYGWNSVMDRVHRNESQPTPDGQYRTTWAKSYWHGD